MGISEIGGRCAKRPLSALLFTLILCLGVSLAPVAFATATVAVSPSSVTAAVEQSFSIDINVSGITNLYAYEFKLGYDPILLEAVNAVEGSFLRTGGETFFTYRVNASLGYFIVDCTLLGIIPGASGSGVLATATFTVTNSGECPLDLYDVKMLNSFEQPIQSQAIDGYGHFTQQHDVAVTNVTTSPTTVLPSEIVAINVSVQNQGTFSETFDATVYANAQAIGTQQASLNPGLTTTIPFTWNTSGYAKGDYSISANASTVFGETDTTDNTGTSDDVITVLYPGHDTAVTRAIPCKQYVGQGYNVNVTVTVKNFGIYSETFDTTAYANGTEIAAQSISLPSGSSQQLLFEWNTTNWGRGGYTISAYAIPSPQDGDTSNNILVNGNVLIGVPGDVSGVITGVPDGVTNMRDISTFCSAFGATLGSSRWNANCDVTGAMSRVPDGAINMRDIADTCAHFDET